jgi:hypothetical protein
VGLTQEQAAREMNVSLLSVPLDHWPEMRLPIP